MGCGFSDTDWQSEMEMHELAIYASVPGLDLNLLTRKYTLIEMDG